MFLLCLFAKSLLFIGLWQFHNKIAFKVISKRCKVSWAWNGESKCHCYKTFSSLLFQENNGSIIFNHYDIDELGQEWSVTWVGFIHKHLANLETLTKGKQISLTA